ncbi:unnamed protein product, partial [marine sediment metagenome]
MTGYSVRLIFREITLERRTSLFLLVMLGSVFFIILIVSSFNNGIKDNLFENFSLLTGGQITINGYIKDEHGINTLIKNRNKLVKEIK